MKFKITTGALFLLGVFDVTGAEPASRGLTTPTKAKTQQELSRVKPEVKTQQKRFFSFLSATAKADASQPGNNTTQGVFNVFMNAFRSCLSSSEKDSSTNDASRFAKAFSFAAKATSSAYNAPSVSMRMIIKSLTYIAEKLNLLSKTQQEEVQADLNVVAQKGVTEIETLRLNVDRMAKENAALQEQLQDLQQKSIDFTSKSIEDKSVKTDKVLDLGMSEQSGVKEVIISDTVLPSLEKAVKEKFSSLSDGDITKITQLVQAIKDAKITSVSQLMRSEGKAYKDLKDALYPEGLPGEGQITQTSLFELSQSGESNLPGAALPSKSSGGLLGSLQQGIILKKAQTGDVRGDAIGKPKNPLLEALQEGFAKSKSKSPQSQSRKPESYVFKTAQARDMARNEARVKAQDVTRSEIASKIEAQFQQDLPAVKSALIDKWAAFKEQPNFNEMINRHVAVEKQERINKAYEGQKAGIEKAGQDAVSFFDQRVQEASGNAPAVQKISRVVKKLDRDAAQINSVKAQAQKAKWGEIIADQVFSGSSQLKEKLRFENPGISEGGLGSLVQSALKAQEVAVRGKAENIALVRKAGEDAVAAWKDGRLIQVETAKDLVVTSKVSAQSDQTMKSYVESLNVTDVSDGVRKQAVKKIFEDLKSLSATSKDKLKFQQELLDRYLAMNAPMNTHEAQVLGYAIITLRNSVHLGT